MAGTRFYIQLSFLVQIICLVLLAVYVEHSTDPFQRHVNDRLFSQRPFFLSNKYRSQLNSLTELTFLRNEHNEHNENDEHYHYSGNEMNEKKEMTTPWRLNINITLRFMILHSHSHSHSHSHPSKDYDYPHYKDSRMISELEDGLNQYTPSHVHVNVNLNLSVATTTTTTTNTNVQCLDIHDATSSDWIQELQHQQQQQQQQPQPPYKYKHKHNESQTHEYTVVMVFGCESDNNNNDSNSMGKESKIPIKVHESGLVIVSIPSSFTHYNEMAQAISHAILHPSPSSSLVSSSSLRPSYQITITLLDQDPSYNHNHNHNHNNFHTLGNQLSQRVQTTLQPFLDRITESNVTTIQNVHVRTKAYTSSSFPIPNPFETEELNGYVFSDVNLLELQDWFVQDIQVSSSHHRYSLSSSLSTHLEYVILLPSARYSPLYMSPTHLHHNNNNYNNDNDHSILGFGGSYHIPGKGGISILNGIHTTTDNDNNNNNNNNNDNNPIMSEETILSQIMEKTLSQIASQIRQELGLPSIPPHRRRQKDTQYSPSPSPSPSYEILYETSHKGITQWEIDQLIRHNIPIQYQSTLQQMHQFVQLLETKSGLEVTEELQSKWTQSIHLLEQAKSVFSSNLPKQSQQPQPQQQPQQEQEPISPSQALHDIHNAQTLMKSIVLDPTLMEHIHTPQEHLLAVFSPLLLPLALPMLIGVIREWKRVQTRNAFHHHNHNKNNIHNNMQKITQPSSSSSSSLSSSTSSSPPQLHEKVS